MIGTEDIIQMSVMLRKSLVGNVFLHHKDGYNQ